jgi:hypothetical protein
MRDWRFADRWLMGEAWTGSTIQQHATQLCDTIGPRWASSAAERQCAEYIGAQLSAAGLKAQLQEFSLRTWAHGEIDARLLPESMPIDLVPVIGCPTFHVRAPLVDVGFGTPDEVDGASGRGLQGAIAVMDMAYQPFTEPVPMPYRLRDLASHGAVAALMIDTKSGGRTELRWAHDMREDGFRDPPLPTATISREQGALLRRRVGDVLDIKVEAESSQAPTANVCAQLAGDLWPQEHLLIGAHHDTVYGTPGGNDNASGVCVVLETARLLAELCESTKVAPGRSIRFATFSAEEQSLQGSTAFVASNYAEASAHRPRLVINLDELSTGHLKGLVLAFEHLRPLVQEQFDDMGENLTCHVMAQLDGTSDHFPFIRAGIDAAHLWRWRFRGRHADSDFHHEAADTVDKINVRELKEYAGQLARLLLRLADIPPPRWPSNDITDNDIRLRLERERGSVVRVS